MIPTFYVKMNEQNKYIIFMVVLGCGAKSIFFFVEIRKYLIVFKNSEELFFWSTTYNFYSIYSSVSFLTLKKGS